MRESSTSVPPAKPSFVDDQELLEAAVLNANIVLDSPIVQNRPLNGWARRHGETLPAEKIAEVTPARLRERRVARSKPNVQEWKFEGRAQLLQHRFEHIALQLKLCTANIRTRRRSCAEHRQLLRKALGIVWNLQEARSNLLEVWQAEYREHFEPAKTRFEGGDQSLSLRRRLLAC